MFIEFGERLDVQSQEALVAPGARAMYAALQGHPHFQLVELRRKGEGLQASDVLVVDCTCDEVPSKNSVGIRYVERLALRFFHDVQKAPDVHALRLDFPITMHQSWVEEGQPKLLCLHAEPWSTVRRGWTPQKHLWRILWWLARAAEGKLHGEDQPLEPLYVESPHELLLPANLEMRLATGVQSLSVNLFSGDLQEDGKTLYVAQVPQGSLDKGGGGVGTVCIAVKVPPVEHGAIDLLPGKLGVLHDQLARRGVDLLSVLREHVGKAAGDKGLLANGAERLTLLVLSIPMTRSSGGAPERILYRGTFVLRELSALGMDIGALVTTDGKRFYKDHLGRGPTSEAWRELLLLPVKMLPAFTRELARQANGTPSQGADAPMTLAGYGSLGSILLNLWHRAGWGRWTLIDPDRIAPHNLARHAAQKEHTGHPKVEVAKDLESHLFPAEETQTRGVFAQANDFSAPQVAEAVDAASLVVDATTTLEVPRDLAVRASVKRACSIFLTPSGRGCVLLLEDAERQMRLSALEAQYYRALISHDWGREHLHGHQGRLWVGAGCRDVTTVIPNAWVSLGASILSAQVMKQAALPVAAIQVWHLDAESGAVATERVAPGLSLMSEQNGWRLFWDKGLQRRVREFRAAASPHETGGILVGYFDTQLRTVHVVDALPPPPDSRGDCTGFTRGTEGLRETLDEVERRTANIVTYVGEWHSHPPGVPARPSPDDRRLIDHLAAALARDGFPALMLIVGEREETWLCRQASSKN